MGMPPANETFFHVATMTCLGSKVSVPTMDSLMSHLVLSLIWTPSLSVREYRSRSNLTYLVSEPWNNGNRMNPSWGVAEIQKMSPPTTGSCYCCH